MTEKKAPPLSPDRDSPASLLRLVPAVLRARDFRLYTRGGRRLVDLWQYGGAAVLGHTPAGALRELKNTAERGLFAPLPHPLEGRLYKALARLFPRRSFRLYGDESSLRRALRQAGYPAGLEPLDMALPLPEASYPALPPASPDKPPGAGPPDGRLFLWRPFTDAIPGLSPAGMAAETPDGTAAGETPTGEPPDGMAADPLPEFFLPVLPLPWPQALRVLAFSPGIAAGRDFPPPDILPPVVLAAAVRGVYGLIAAAPERANPRFHKLDAALLAGPWRRRGIYLSYGEAQDDDAYGLLFRRFLDRDFLLPPSRNLPAIIPGILSPGEEVRLAGLLK